MFLVFRMNNKVKEYLMNQTNNCKKKFKSIVKAKYYLAEHLKLTDMDIFLQNINFEEIGDNENVD